MRFFRGLILVVLSVLVFYTPTFAARSTATLTNRSPATDTIVLGYESDGTTPRYVPAANGSSIFLETPTAGSWQTSNGPSNTAHFGLYKFTAMAPCEEAVAFDPQIFVAVSDITPASGSDYDTSDANTLASFYFISDTNDAIPVDPADISDGTKISEFISGTSPNIEDVTRGSSGPYATFDSGYSIVGNLDATYNGLTNNVAGDATVDVLVVHSFNGGTLTTEALTTEDPVVTVDWDVSNCPQTTPTTSQNTSTTAAETLADTGDSQIYLSLIATLIVMTGMLLINRVQFHKK